MSHNLRLNNQDIQRGKSGCYINNDGRHIMWEYLGSKSLPGDKHHLCILLSMSLKWAVSIRPSKLNFTKYFSLHPRFLLTAWPPGNSCCWHYLQHVFMEKKMIFSFHWVPPFPFSRILYCIHSLLPPCELGPERSVNLPKVLLWGRISIPSCVHILVLSLLQVVYLGQKSDNREPSLITFLLLW